MQRKVRAKAGACVQQRVISAEAAAYLTNWVDGCLPRVPRPVRYPFLQHSVFPRDGPGPILDWRSRGREKHVDLKFEEDEEADSGSDCAYEPIMDDGGED